ncbi:MAG: hypothetical protein LUQ65_02900 [Candidatus Helarchaeota archaeon]|nr:hypothetical protein [Candidatus Helarchaeota archaeon]
MDRRKYEMIGRLVGSSTLWLLPIFIMLILSSPSYETIFPYLELYCALVIIIATILASFWYRYGRNLPKPESQLIYASHLTSEVELEEKEENG